MHGSRAFLTIRRARGCSSRGRIGCLVQMGRLVCESSFLSPNTCFIEKQLKLFIQFLKLLIKEKEELTLHSSSAVERPSLVNSTVGVNYCPSHCNSHNE